MKKAYLIISALIFFHTFCHGQTDSLMIKKKCCDRWGFSIAINSFDAQVGDPEWDSWGYAKANFFNFGDIKNKSLSLSFLPRYFVTTNIEVHFEFGITNINLTSYYDSKVNNLYGDHLIIIQNIGQKIYRYISGVQWDFMKKKKINPYVGVNAIYLHYSDMSYHNSYEDRSLPVDSLISGHYDNAKATGGYAAGLSSFVGANIYIQKHISFGAEFSSALLYKKIGGEFGGIVTNQNNPNQPPTTETYIYSTNSYMGFQFSKIFSAFNISVWL